MSAGLNASKPITELLYLNGMRAVAAIYVVMHHAMIHYRLRENEMNFFQGLVEKTLLYGHFAVDLFIVISGFSLMLPYIKRDYADLSILTFYWRRIRRILPPYYFSVLLSLLLVYTLIGERTNTHWDISLPVGYTDICMHFLLVHDLFASQAFKINHLLWSIAVECRIYLFFPLLLFFWKRRGAIFTLFVILLISLGIYSFLMYTQRFYSNINLGPGFSPYIVLFALGMFAADVSFSESKIAKALDKINLAFLMLILIVPFAVFKKMLFVLKINLGGDWEAQIADLIFGGICFCLLVICARKKYDQSPLIFLKHFFSWKPIVFIGTFAYSIYLIHAPMLALISEYVISPLHLSGFFKATVLTIGGTGIIVCLSYGFFLLFEKPFLNNKKRLAQTEVDVAVNPAP